MLEANLIQLFDKAVHQHKNKIAFKDSKRSITYGELEKEVNKIAEILQLKGVKPLERVAVRLNNNLDYIIVDFALIKVGATRVMLNMFLGDDEITYRINDSGAKMFICEEKYLDNINEMKHEIANDLTILTIGGSSSTNLHELVTQVEGVPTKVSVEDTDPTIIMYTGGTTGRSKGVIHTHKTVMAITFSEIVELEINRGERMLHVAPLPHAAGFLTLPGLLRGGMQVIQDGFDPIVFCETVEKEKITFSFLVPTMIYMILDLADKDKYDFTSVHTITYGAAPMAPTRLKEAIKLMGNVFLQLYSQAEVANQTTVLNKADHLYALEHNENILSSCGRSIIMSQVRIVDSSGETCNPNEVGEIVTKGPHMMEGYWNLEEATKDTIRDGWLYTGDVAYMDEEGYIYLVDRKNDIIISGGFNVYTTTVEKVLFEHPDVMQATVVGVPDDRWGEVVKAFVVPNQDTVNEALLIAYCKKKLSKYEVPKSIEIVEDLPLTAYGKIDKKKLRSFYWDDAGRKVN